MAKAAKKAAKRRERKAGLGALVAEPRERAADVIYAGLPKHPVKRATKRANADGIDRATWLAVLVRDGFRCCYCGGEAEEVEHVLPWVAGGSNRPENLVAVCGECNARRKEFRLRPWLRVEFRLSVRAAESAARAVARRAARGVCAAEREIGRAYRNIWEAGKAAMRAGDAGAALRTEAALVELARAYGAGERSCAAIRRAWARCVEQVWEG